MHTSPLLHEFRPQARHDLRGKGKRDRAAVGNSFMGPVSLGAIDERYARGRVRRREVG